MRTLFAILLLTMSQLVFSDEKEQSDVKEASMENTLLNHLIGEWNIKDWSLDKQGQWQEGQGADWNWYKILDGQAIQDDWIAPSLSHTIEPGQRQFGTNIRIYNPQKKQWEMAWMSSNGKKLDTFSAQEYTDKVVMTGYYAGTDSRITFFNIGTDAFDWKLELQQKDKSWLEAYRIKGTRKQ
ncbi:hypothetical protein [Marinicella sp. W31]|uniref:hypothetical protein n=1 Tax=Marinicella sp. W31 TaxID=3023713 RepID=UPI0037577434